MRLAPDEPQRARLRRSTLLVLTGAASASLVAALFLPRWEPWLGTARAPTLIASGGATLLAAAAWIGSERQTTWTALDKFAWMVALAALTLLSGASSAPIGVQGVLQFAALAALAFRDPSTTVSIVACATAAFVPVVRAVVTPNVFAVTSSAFLSVTTTLVFLALSMQTRRLAQVLSERDRLAATATRATATPAVVAPGAPRTSRTNEPADTGRRETAEHGWDGLVERVRASVTTVAQSAGVAAIVQAEVDGLAPPSTKMRASVLRIAQEATTQAIRNAEPRSIVITLRRADGGVVLEFADDGASGNGARQRRSLASLRGRVAALGGTAEVRRSDSGWVTCVRLPCEQLN